MAEYVYRALENQQDLRLLVLHPAPNSDDPIVVSLKHHKRFSSKYDISQLEQLHDNYWDAHRGFVDAELSWQAAHAKYVSDCEELGIASAVLQANAQGHYGQTRSSYTAARAKLKTLKKEYDKHDWNDIIEEHNTLFINVPSYEAVSYAWGTEEATEPINVEENLSSRKILFVRRNVANMLQHLRSDAKRLLWIDALCINQSDVSEKETQVQLMGDTYSQAQRVLIWIGSRRGSPRGGYSQLTELGLNRKSLKFLINQLWFSRRWVIQEVARSYTAIVVWGDEMMDFEKFVQYASQCATTTVLTTMEREALVRLASIVLCRDTASAVNNQRPLLQLLVDFHAAQCSDDRDRLYALKGLSSCSIVVDYEQSADAVYRGFAAAELLLHPGLVLACAGAFRSNPGTLDTGGESTLAWNSNTPTWIPDWRVSPSYIPFSMSEDLTSDASYTHDMTAPIDGMLQCTGFQAAVVLKVLTFRLPLSMTSPEQTTQSRFWGSWAFFRLNQAFPTYQATGPIESSVSIYPAKARDIFIEAVTAGNYRTGKCMLRAPSAPRGEDAAALTISETLNMWHWPLTSPTGAFNGASEDEVTNTREEQVAIRTMIGRTCFFTAAGKFGIGPEHIRPGDEVIALAGGSRRLIALRPTKAPELPMMPDGQMVSVVGDCYIPELTWEQEPNRLSRYYIV